MSYSLSNDYGKKFQLTDSLLRRRLRQGEYENIKIVEPAIIVTNDESGKQLKSPGYKHAAISNKYLYVVNTPAKQDSDLIYTIPLQYVKDIKFLYDAADFLQGELQKQAQHIQLVCIQPNNKNALQPEGTLSSSSQGNNVNEFSIPKIIEKPASSEALLVEPSNNKNTSNVKLSSRKSKGKIKGLSKTSEVGLGNKSLTRPLPKPMNGTETLNASYTSSMFLDVKNRGRDIIPTHTLSQSKSYDCLSKLAEKRSVNLNNNLTASFTSRRPQSLNMATSYSWNEILKAEHNFNKCRQTTQHLEDASESSNNIEGNKNQSNSLTQSFSGKLSKFFGSRDDVFDNSPSPVGPSSQVKSRSRSSSNSQTASVSFEDKKDENENTIEDYFVDFFTVSKSSKLYNILKETWIAAVIAGTLNLENKHCLQRNGQSSAIKFENNNIVQKLTQLKEEVLGCHQDDQLFLLTKEMKYACKNYLVAKRVIWKSPTLLRFYLSVMDRLLKSCTRSQSERMDELDLLIIIGELFVCAFEETELLSSRNMFLNENSALFIKDFVRCILQPPISTIGERKCHEELNELVKTWLNTCVLLLYEVINAANQSSWSCSYEEKSFDVTLLSHAISQEVNSMRCIVEHIIQNLMCQLTLKASSTLPPADTVLLYKELEILLFICTNCAKIYQNIKTFHHEEIKYYISKNDNLQRVPKHYPLSSILAVKLPNVVRLLTE